LEAKTRPDGEASRLKLNTIQVAAGALAAISSAVAASYLSVGGTIIGAAVGSVVTTTAGAVYSYYLERTRSRLRDVVTPVLGRTGIARVVVAEEDRRPDAGDPGAPDLEQPAASDRAAVTEGLPEGAQTAPVPAAGSPGWQISPRRLVPLGVVAVLIFGIAMGAITLFEGATGKPVSATVKGQENVSASTTFGAIAKGGASGGDRKQDGDPTPTQTPTEESTESPGTPSDEGSTEPSPDTSESPAPEPTGTGEPSEQPEPGGQEPTGQPEPQNAPPGSDGGVRGNGLRSPATD
jgi:hypothetical protein